MHLFAKAISFSATGSPFHRSNHSFRAPFQFLGEALPCLFFLFVISYWIFRTSRPDAGLSVAYLLGFIRGIVCWLLHLVGLGEFLENMTSSWEDQGNPWLEVNFSVSAQKIREFFLVVEFGVLVEGSCFLS